MTEYAEIPQEVLAEHVREQVKLASEVHVQNRVNNHSEIDKWEHIDTADLDWIEWADGDLHTMFKSETTVRERVARPTHNHPAEYKETFVDVEIGVMWDFESKPEVWIEVVNQ